MEILLAGYNLDAEAIAEISKETGRQDLTPETISAAYARISRNPRPVHELRAIARQEVEKARRSNKNIIFGMGHHSVAEHAVFNFDIIGVSRLAVEAIQHFRLCSFTEKSQRYITLDNDFVIPEEIHNTPEKSLFEETIHLQNRLYHRLHERLRIHVFEKFSELAADPKNNNLLEGWAKEDARYITSLATESQLGMTVNARNLELLIRRFAAHPFHEVKTIGNRMYQRVKHIAPSIILFTEASEYDLSTYPAIGKITDTLSQKLPPLPEKPVGTEDVRLIQATSGADDLVVSALLHSTSSISFEECKHCVASLSDHEKKNIIMEACRRMELFDATLREFEFVTLTFSLVVSSTCFAQLKRHRMATLTTQQYDPRLGVTIPESIRETGMEKEFLEVIKKTEAVYAKISQSFSPSLAQYILTNAHRRRVLMGINARDLYHFSRLREDKHAQWDIRSITSQMAALAKGVMPLTMLLIGGKDQYPEIYEEVYGHPPKVIEPILPS